MLANKRIVVLRTFDTYACATFCRDMLRENGIEAFLSDENIVQLYPVFSSPFGGIRLHVFDSDVLAAETILKNIES